MIGSDVDACTSDTMSAEGASDVISHDAPTPWIRLPKFDTRFATQIAKNVRCRKGANVLTAYRLQPARRRLRLTVAQAQD